MAYIRKTERAIFVVLTSRSLSAATRLLVPLLLGLTAVWVLMVAVGTKTVTVAQEDYYAVSEGSLAPRPIVVTTIPLSISPPLIHAAVAVNPTTGYAYILGRTQSPSPNGNLTIISGTELIFSNTSPDYGGALTVDPNLSVVYMPINGGLAVMSSAGQKLLKPFL